MQWLNIYHRTDTRHCFFGVKNICHQKFRNFSKFTAKLWATSKPRTNAVDFISPEDFTYPENNAEDDDEEGEIDDLRMEAGGIEDDIIHILPPSQIIHKTLPSISERYMNRCLGFNGQLDIRRKPEPSPNPQTNKDGWLGWVKMGSTTFDKHYFEIVSRENGLNAKTLRRNLHQGDSKA